MNAAVRVKPRAANQAEESEQKGKRDDASPTGDEGVQEGWEQELAGEKPPNKGEAMSAEWYCQIHGTVYGPLSANDLDRLGPYFALQDG